MGQNAIFQDENARFHRARIVDNFLQLNGVLRLEWPPMSPDCHALSTCGIFLIDFVSFIFIFTWHNSTDFNSVVRGTYSILLC